MESGSYPRPRNAESAPRGLSWPTAAVATIWTLTGLAELAIGSLSPLFGDGISFYGRGSDDWLRGFPKEARWRFEIALCLLLVAVSSLRFVCVAGLYQRQRWGDVLGPAIASVALLIDTAICPSPLVMATAGADLYLLAYCAFRLRA